MNIEGRAREGKTYMEEDDEKECIKQMFEIGKKSIDVLEWGAGYSTKIFTEILRNNRIDYNWDAIEYNKDWYVLVKSWMLPKVNLFLFEEKSPADEKMKDYVNFPKDRRKKYDLIFIDGRKRVRCLEVAKECLKEGGFVLLHDAQRIEYRDGFEGYDYEFLSIYLWKGKLKR